MLSKVTKSNVQEEGVIDGPIEMGLDRGHGGWPKAPLRVRKLGGLFGSSRAFLFRLLSPCSAQACPCGLRAHCERGRRRRGGKRRGREGGGRKGDRETERQRETENMIWIW